MQRWVFRLNIPSCLTLGTLVYNASDVREQNRTSRALSYQDLTAAVLLMASLIPILVGLSLAGGLYGWTEWPVLTCIIFGFVCTCLLVVTEVFPAAFWRGDQSLSQPASSLLGLRRLSSVRGAATFGSAVFLGVLVRLPDQLNTPR